MHLSRRLPTLRSLAAASVIAALVLPIVAIAALASGPPYPDPVSGQRVYDTAGIFDQATISAAQATMDGIYARTGAEIIVYSEKVDYDLSSADAESNAQALMDHLVLDGLSAAH